MWPTRFEAAGQVRAFPSYRGQRDFPSWYWAATCSELVGYESWVGLGHLMRLDAEPDVVAVTSEPFRLLWRYSGRGRRLKHTPDYFVRRSDGTAVVLDVRPDERIEPEGAAKFAATAATCPAKHHPERSLILQFDRDIEAPAARGPMALSPHQAGLSCCPIRRIASSG